MEAETIIKVLLAITGIMLIILIIVMIALKVYYDRKY